MKFSHPFPLTVLLLALTVISCSKEKDSDPLYVIAGNANSMETVPATNTNAIGSISGIFNPVTKKVAYNLTWGNFSSEAQTARFFILRDNQPDSLLYTLIITERRTTGNLGGHIFLDERLTESLLGQKWCYAITSKNYAEGEVRGKIIVAQ